MTDAEIIAFVVAPLTLRATGGGAALFFDWRARREDRKSGAHRTPERHLGSGLITNS